MYHKRGDQYGNQSETVTGLIFMHIHKKGDGNA